MERMEHFRGKLLNGEEVFLDQIEGYLGFHTTSSGHKTWFGHFEIPIEQRANVNPGIRYKLFLSDGRNGELYVDLHDSNTPGKCTGEFQLIGTLKEKKSLKHY
jgi:hypothetical protein